MPAIRFGKYSLVARLGAGGMAELLLARMNGSMGFEKVVALKRILPHLASEKEFVQMFLDEARLVARINHPNVVQIFDFGAESGTYYIAMEFLSGADLATVAVTWLKRGKLMPVADVCLAISQAATGLHAAHELKDGSGKSLGLVHRDVSPQNLFLTFDGVCKVLDFGVAKAAGRLSNTQTGNIKGKISYMAPEHARAETIDRRADLYSLGICLWELLAGRRLFKAETEAATLSKVLLANVPDVRQANPDVPEAVAQIVVKALSPKPKDRFQTGEEMSQALEDAMLAAGFRARPALLGKQLRELLPERFRQSEALLETAAKGETSGLLETAVVEAIPLPNQTPSKPLIPAQALMEDKTPADPMPAAKKSHTGLWVGVALGLLLLGGGGTAAWSFYEEQSAQAEARARKEAEEKAAREREMAEKAKALEDKTAALEKATREAAERQKRLEASLAQAVERQAEKPVVVERIVAVPAAARAPQPKGFGFLTLDTAPWTQVYLGDQDLGVTPLSRVRLPAGHHTLVLKNPTKGISTSVEIDVAADQTTTRKFAL